GADVLLTGAAQPTTATRLDRVDCGATADPLLRPGAGGDDLPSELVTHHERRGAVAHAPEVALDLRAADPHGARAHHHLIGSGILRRGALADLHAPRALPDD